MKKVQALLLSLMAMAPMDRGIVAMKKQLPKKQSKTEEDEVSNPKRQKTTEQGTMTDPSGEQPIPVELVDPKSFTVQRMLTESLDAERKTKEEEEANKARQEATRAYKLDQKLRIRKPKVVQNIGDLTNHDLRIFLIDQKHFPSTENVNFIGLNKRTPLHWVATSRPEFIDDLVAAGALVDSKDLNGVTPLHLAAHFNNEDAVKALLAKYADFNVENIEGLTPLDYAQKGKSEAAIKALKAVGAKTGKEIKAWQSIDVL